MGIQTMLSYPHANINTVFAHHSIRWSKEYYFHFVFEASKWKTSTRLLKRTPKCKPYKQRNLLVYECFKRTRKQNISVNKWNIRGKRLCFAVVLQNSKFIHFKLTHTHDQTMEQYIWHVCFHVHYTLLETTNKWRNKTWEWNKSKIHHGDFQPLSPIHTTPYEQQT